MYIDITVEPIQLRTHAGALCIALTSFTPNAATLTVKGGGEIAGQKHVFHYRQEGARARKRLLVEQYGRSAYMEMVHLANALMFAEQGRLNGPSFEFCGVWLKLHSITDAGVLLSTAETNHAPWRDQPQQLVQFADATCYVASNGVISPIDVPPMTMLLVCMIQLARVKMPRQRELDLSANAA